MALLTARQTTSLPRVATTNALTQIRRESGFLQRCTSWPARHRSRHHAVQQLQKGCSTLESSLYHKGCVYVASWLLLTVTIRGLAKIQTMRCAVAAVWALMGTFVLAGGCSVKRVTTCLPPQPLESLFTADLVSALYHFLVDNYGDQQTPVVGKLIMQVQEHHMHPWMMTLDPPCRRLHQVD